MKETECEICPVCFVKIEDDAKVIFSTGKPGTRERLFARVCKFTKNPDCINLKKYDVEKITSSDYYG